MKVKHYSGLNELETIVTFTSLLILLNACNGVGNSPTNSITQPQQQSLNILNSVSVTNNNPQISQALLGSTLGNQQYFTVLQVPGAVVMASETITFYTDSACSTKNQAAIFTGPAIYSGGSSGHTTDQSLYYTCTNMFTGGCSLESSTINSIQFSYAMTNGQTTTMNCMTNERIANYSTTPKSACTTGSPCGFSTSYNTYTLFPGFDWVGGGSTINGLGIYGTQGTESSSNIPGARYSSNNWIDGSGNLWLFGGKGYPESGASGDLNDLWKYNQSSKKWTWVSGAKTINGFGVYGTKGTSSSTTIPGARDASISWTDSSGNLWLFGGDGYAASGAYARLNDLWEYTQSSKQWTWVSGESTTNSSGVYGTQGTPTTTTKPGARWGSISWIDGSGNMWLFGGCPSSPTSANTDLNDLWKYNPTAKLWTWVSGESTTNSPGVYGTQGTPSSSTKPGARDSAVSWIDSSGNLWLFGGGGYVSTTYVHLNDLWKYNTTTKLWTWVSGASTANASGVYGTQGTPASTNTPGARWGAASWTDESSNLWLFAGFGYDKNGSYNNLNDLWQYNTTTNLWTWVSGASTVNGIGVYGTQGVSSSSNITGSRNSSIRWVDSANNLWLFGGNGYAKTASGGSLSDLWEINLGH